MQICSDDSEAFVRTSTLTATAGACLSPKGELRRSWSKKVRERSRKRSVERKLHARPGCDRKEFCMRKKVVNVYFTVTCKAFFEKFSRI